MRTEADFQLDFLLDVKALTNDDDGGFYVEGYASEFGVDRQDEIFEPDAFDHAMKAFMDTNPVLLFHHKFDQALGQVVNWFIDKKGMWIKAHLDQPEPNTFLADVFNKVKSGTIKGFSVGGKFHRREGAGGITKIHKADIMEISLTPMPVNSATLATVCQKAFAEPDDMKALETQYFAVAAELGRLEGKAGLTPADRKKEAKSGAAMKDGSYPISTSKDVHDAVDDYDRTGAGAAVKEHIIERAKAIGAVACLPPGWGRMG